MFKISTTDVSFKHKRRKSIEDIIRENELVDTIKTIVGNTKEYIKTCNVKNLDKEVLGHYVASLELIICFKRKIQKQPKTITTRASSNYYGLEILVLLM